MNAVSKAIATHLVLAIACSTQDVEGIDLSCAVDVRLPTAALVQTTPLTEFD